MRIRLSSTIVSTLRLGLYSSIKLESSIYIILHGRYQCGERSAVDLERRVSRQGIQVPEAMAQVPL